MKKFSCFFGIGISGFFYANAPVQFWEQSYSSMPQKMSELFEFYTENLPKNELPKTKSFQNLSTLQQKAYLAMMEESQIFDSERTKKILNSMISNDSKTKKNLLKLAKFHISQFEYDPDCEASFNKIIENLDKLLAGNTEKIVLFDTFQAFEFLKSYVPKKHQNTPIKIDQSDQKKDFEMKKIEISTKNEPISEQNQNDNKKENCNSEISPQKYLQAAFCDFYSYYFWHENRTIFGCINKEIFSQAISWLTWAGFSAGMFCAGYYGKSCQNSTNYSAQMASINSTQDLINFLENGAFSQSLQSMPVWQNIGTTLKSFQNFSNILDFIQTNITSTLPPNFASNFLAEIENNYTKIPALSRISTNFQGKSPNFTRLFDAIPIVDQILASTNAVQLDFLTTKASSLSTGTIFSRTNFAQETENSEQKTEIIFDKVTQADFTQNSPKTPSKLAPKFGKNSKFFSPLSTSNSPSNGLTSVVFDLGYGLFLQGMQLSYQYSALSALNGIYSCPSSEISSVLSAINSSKNYPTCIRDFNSSKANLTSSGMAVISKILDNFTLKDCVSYGYEGEGSDSGSVSCSSICEPNNYCLTSCENSYFNSLFTSAISNLTELFNAFTNAYPASNYDINTQQSVGGCILGSGCTQEPGLNCGYGCLFDACGPYQQGGTFASGNNLASCGSCFGFCNNNTACENECSDCLSLPANFGSPQNCAFSFCTEISNQTQAENCANCMSYCQSSAGCQEACLSAICSQFHNSADILNCQNCLNVCGSDTDCQSYCSSSSCTNYFQTVNDIYSCYNQCIIPGYCQKDNNSGCVTGCLSDWCYETFLTGNGNFNTFFTNCASCGNATGTSPYQTKNECSNCVEQFCLDSANQDCAAGCLFENRCQNTNCTKMAGNCYLKCHGNTDCQAACFNCFMNVPALQYTSCSYTPCQNFTSSDSILQCANCIERNYCSSQDYDCLNACAKSYCYNDLEKLKGEVDKVTNFLINCYGCQNATDVYPYTDAQTCADCTAKYCSSSVDYNCSSGCLFEDCLASCTSQNCTLNCGNCMKICGSNENCQENCKYSGCASLTNSTQISSCYSQCIEPNLCQKDDFNCLSGCLNPNCYQYFYNHLRSNLGSNETTFFFRNCETCTEHKQEASIDLCFDCTMEYCQNLPSNFSLTNCLNGCSFSECLNPADATYLNFCGICVLNCYGNSTCKTDCTNCLNSCINFEPILGQSWTPNNETSCENGCQYQECLGSDPIEIVNCGNCMNICGSNRTCQIGCQNPTCSTLKTSNEITNCANNYNSCLDICNTNSTCLTGCQYCPCTSFYTAPEIANCGSCISSGFCPPTDLNCVKNYMNCISTGASVFSCQYVNCASCPSFNQIDICSYCMNWCQGSNYDTSSVTCSADPSACNQICSTKTPCSSCTDINPEINANNCSYCSSWCSSRNREIHFQCKIQRENCANMCPETDIVNTCDEQHPKYDGCSSLTNLAEIINCKNCMANFSQSPACQFTQCYKLTSLTSLNDCANCVDICNQNVCGNSASTQVQCDECMLGCSYTNCQNCFSATDSSGNPYGAAGLENCGYCTNWCLSEGRTDISLVTCSAHRNSCDSVCFDFKLHRVIANVL